MLKIVDFSAAGLAEQRQQLALPDLQIKPVHGDIGRSRAALVERFRDLLEADDGGGRGHSDRSETAR
jgi:hypothetical protein